MVDSEMTFAQDLDSREVNMPVAKGTPFPRLLVPSDPQILS